MYICFSDYKDIQYNYLLKDTLTNGCLDKTKKILKNELVSRISSLVCGTALSVGILISHFVNSVDEILTGVITFDAKRFKNAGQYLFLALSQPVVLEGLAVMGVFVPQKAKELAYKAEKWKKWEEPNLKVKTGALQGRILCIVRGITLGISTELQTPSRFIIACFEKDTMNGLGETCLHAVGLPLSIFFGIYSIFDEKTRKDVFKIKISSPQTVKPIA